MNDNFESQVLGRMDTMGKGLVDLNERITIFEGETKSAFNELSGRIKGNQELIIKDLSNYVEKETCAIHRETQGSRIGNVEGEIEILQYRFGEFIKDKEKKDELTSNAIIAWLPDLLKVIITVGGVIFIVLRII